MPVLKSFIALLLGIMLNSCNYEYKYDATSPIADVPLDSVKSELWFPELMAVNARTMVSMQEKLCLVGPDDYTLTYYIDEKTGKELGYAGMVGEGPEDMQPFPSYVGKSEQGDTIYLYDFNVKKLNAYRLAETTDGKPKLELLSTQKLPNPMVGRYTSSYMGFVRLENGYYVGLNFLSLGENFLTLLDKDLNIVKEFGEQPLGGLASEGGIKSFQSFDGTLCAQGNSVYYAASKLGYMARYDITEQGEVTHRWTHRYADIHYRVEGKQRIKYQPDNRNGFSDMTVGKKYIFATYSGIPMRVMFEKRSVYAIGARELAVFNHDGEPVGRFKLRSCSFTVGLSEDEEYVYVMNIDPEVQIERIRVSDMEKAMEEGKQQNL